MKRRRKAASNSLNRAGSALTLLAALCLLCGCPQLESWKQQQISQSRQAAAPARVVAPATPLTVPPDIRDAVAMEDTFTVLSVSENDGSFELELLSTFDAVMTAQWLLSNMQARGYEAQDNPSRIVEDGGLEFLKEGADFALVRAQVTLNTSDQVTIRYSGQRRQ